MALPLFDAIDLGSDAAFGSEKNSCLSMYLYIFEKYLV